MQAGGCIYYLLLKMHKRRVVLNFYSRSESGHRKNYIEFITSVYKGKRIGGIDLWAFKKEPLLFLMVEENVILYFIVSIYRSLFGSKTYGLVFRPESANKFGGGKYKIKYYFMRLLKRIDAVKSISIIPFDELSPICKVCDDWIHDIQFWDLEFLLSSVDGDEVNFIKNELTEDVSNKLLVVALGGQNVKKGVDQFMELYLSSQDLRERYRFIVAGKLSYNNLDKVERFVSVGGEVIDRRISDAELVGLYELSDLVWACYSPNYDQSSGIFGRAIQFNTIPIVREGSNLEKMCSSMALRCIAISYPVSEKDCHKIIELPPGAIACEGVDGFMPKKLII